ncbi:hypothetical protein JTB14_003367 [Gonioctena quinquepunctata]|nr:hypothetical protein JTB14_003367 [Gonioctena quinquepunctata]
MSLNRYLLYMAYMGKPFRGVQSQIRRDVPREDDPLTIQGRLEMGLKELNPVNDPIITLSSRTDSGVHAISSTCHVDLHRRNGSIYEPQSVTLCLNRYFLKQDVPIRILKTFIVPNAFHCRFNAISRSYLYRLIISNRTLNRNPLINYIPIEEWQRCVFLCTENFNLDLMKQGATLLEGYHDFRSFMGTNSNHQKLTRRTLEYIKIIKRERTGYSSFSWPSLIEPDLDKYIFLDVNMKSKGFLYKQVVAGFVVPLESSFDIVLDERRKIKYSSKLLIVYKVDWPFLCISIVISKRKSEGRWRRWLQLHKVKSQLEILSLCWKFLRVIRGVPR